jgi:hypothetical protein
MRKRLNLGGAVVHVLGHTLATITCVWIAVNTNIPISPCAFSPEMQSRKMTKIFVQPIIPDESFCLLENGSHMPS